MRKLPNFYYEKLVGKKISGLIAGLDEAGRGALAGPLVCAAVVFSDSFSEISKLVKDQKININDSKKMTSLQREKSFKWIKKNALTWGVGVASVAEINKKGIAKATFSGFRRAIKNAEERINRRIDFILIDAFYVPYIAGINMPRKMIRKANRKAKRLKIQANQLALVHGDEKSFSIAAASIIAKVYRDRLMKKISEKKAYQKYNWDKNKGYGTKDHIFALKKYGKTRLHRRLFIDSIIES